MSLKSVHSAMILDALEAEIVSGELTPGSRLSEEALAQRFGVSRTPVREALQVIVSRSLAERVPYKGVVVCNFEAQRIQSMFEAMAEIEAVCGGFAAARMTKSALERLQATHERMAEMAAYKASREYEAINIEFHSMIYDGGGNQDLAQMATDMRLKLAPFRKSQLFREDRLLESNREHALILQLLKMRNKPGVEQALRDHLGGAQRAVMKSRQEAD